MKKKTAQRLLTLSFLSGAAAVIAGVTIIYWPATLILVGAAVFYLSAEGLLAMRKVKG